MIIDRVVNGTTSRVVSTATAGQIPDIPLLWNIVNRNDFLSKRVNSFAINTLINSAPHRPYPFSLRSDYTTWPSLTDRTFTCRHLGPASENYISRLPNINAVAALYKRPEGTEGKLSHNSSVLFPAFAMWFTDGFLRSDPKDIRKNLSNHQIDLCQIYGLNEEVTHKLRSGKEGKFKYQDINGAVYPPYAYKKDGTLREAFNGLEFFPTGHKLEDTIKPRKTRLFAMGTPQSNSTPGYIAFNTLMLREHNRIAEELMNAYPAWDDERLFQTARNIMIVQLIKIVVEEYINHIAPVSFKFRADPSFTYDEDWYRSNWMTLEFNILYRWHALFPTALMINQQPVSFDEFMYNTDLVVDRGIAPLMDDMSRQQACQPGLFNTPYFLQEIERKNLHLCRAHRVQSYNAYREHFSLPKAHTFRDISTNPEILEALQKLYKTVDDVEFYVGLYAEDRGPASLFGPLLSVMVAVDAFSQALTNPLLAKNVFNVATFSQVGMDIINSTHRIADILHRNTDDTEDLACSLGYVGEQSAAAGGRTGNADTKRSYEPEAVQD